MFSVLSIMFVLELIFVWEIVCLGRFEYEMIVCWQLSLERIKFGSAFYLLRWEAMCDLIHWFVLLCLH